MNTQPPQWPSQANQPDQPDQPDRPPDGSSASLSALASRLSQLARSRLALAGVAIVSGVLIVALLCTLLLVFSSNARGTTPGGQAQNGATATTDSAQTATAAGSGDGSGTPVSGAVTPSSSGGTGGTHPTPTPPRPTATTSASPSVHQVVSQARLSGSSVGSVVVSCPAGELALSGGWSIPSNSGATVIRSSRSSTRGWTIAVYYTADVLVTSYAECLKNAPGATIAEQSAVAYAQPHYDNNAVPTCNDNERLVGGGFELPDTPDMEVYIFYNIGTQWMGRARTHGAATYQFAVYAECLTYGGVKQGFPTSFQQSTIAAGSRGTVYSPACPTGSYLSGGSYQYDGDAIVYAMHAQLVLSETGGSLIVWGVSLDANGGHSEMFSVTATCLEF